MLVAGTCVCTDVHPAGGSVLLSHIPCQMYALDVRLGCMWKHCQRGAQEKVYSMQVVCGGEHTMVICRQGRVFSWGRGNCGQTGLGTTDTVKLPARLEALEDHCVTQVTITHGPDRRGVGFPLPA